MRNVTLGTGRVGIADAAAVSRNARRSKFPRKSFDGSITRAIVDRAAAGDEPIYGLNTALGANTGAPLAPEEQQRYQTREFGRVPSA
jgi:histidine ammonia-lyase